MYRTVAVDRQPSTVKRKTSQWAVNMKKIDKYLLSSFIGPFVVSFGIALFVLVMQFLWLYIDEIAGKGASILILLELIGYMSISTFPDGLANCGVDRLGDGYGQLGGAL